MRHNGRHTPDGLRTIRFEMGYASAIATVLFTLMLGTNVFTQKMLRKIGE